MNLTGKIIKPLILLTASVVPALTILFISEYKTRTKNSEPLCRDCNIIIVSLDTLGSGHLPCYGYARDTMPNLCTYASENVLFENAYSNSFWTLPATPTMMTGLFPQVHNIMKYTSILPKSIPLLPEVLKRNGYYTIFASPGDDLAIPLDNVYNRGIDKYMDDGNWKELFNEFENSVSSGKKTFMYVHNYSVHAPYMTENRPKIYTTDNVKEIPVTFDEIYNTFSPELFEYIYTQASKDIAEGTQKAEPFEGFLRFYEKNKGNYPAVRDYYKNLLKNNLGPNWVYMYWYNWYRKIDKTNPRHIEYIKALYDQKLNELDSQEIPALIKFMSRPEISGNTILIVTSEHGEEFAEHGEINHITVYNSNIRIPFIVHIPGMNQKKIMYPANLADISPTLLGLTGVKDKVLSQGEDLTGIMKGGQGPDRLILIKGEMGKKDAVIYKDLKLFFKMNDGRITPLELYDLTNDPDEKNNILFTRFKDAENIKDTLLKYIENWNSKNDNKFMQNT